MTDSNPSHEDEPTDENAALDPEPADDQPVGDPKPIDSQPAKSQPSASGQLPSEDDQTRMPDEQRVIRALTWGALGIACVVAVGALHQFYFNTAAAIETFVASEYESLFLAGFNLVVLFVAGVAISLLVRELSAGGRSSSESAGLW